MTPTLVKFSKVVKALQGFHTSAWLFSNGDLEIRRTESVRTPLAEAPVEKRVAILVKGFCKPFQSRHDGRGRDAETVPENPRYEGETVKSVWGIIFHSGNTGVLTIGRPEHIEVYVNDQSEHDKKNCTGMAYNAAHFVHRGGHRFEFSYKAPFGRPNDISVNTTVTIQTEVKRDGDASYDAIWTLDDAKQEAA